MSFRADSSKYFPLKFQRASSLMGLYSGIEELDKMLGFINKGQVVFIEGSHSRKHLLELFCLRSILQYNNYCIFVDVGNSFDPYLLAKLVKRKEPKEVLNKIIISRAFTVHQLAYLIINETTKIIDLYPSNLVAVSDLLHLFTDPESDIDRNEIEFILPRILKSLNSLTNQKDAIVVVTSDTKNCWLNRMVESYSNIVLTVNDDRENVRINLDKHPTKTQTFLDLTLNDLMLNSKAEERRPLTLEQWAMVNG